MDLNGSSRDFEERPYSLLDHEQLECARDELASVHGLQDALE